MPTLGRAAPVSEARAAGTMSENRATQDNLLKGLALCGVAIPIVFAVLVTVGGFIYEGYSHVTQAVSELSGVEAQHPWVQTTNFFVVGALFVPFALGLRRGIGAGQGSRVGPVLVAISGVSACIGGAFFPCDPGCEFQSLTGTLHNVAGLTGFVAAIAGMFVISRRIILDSYWQALYRFSWIFGIAALVSLVLWIGVAKAAEVCSVNGVLQRLFIGVRFIWVEVMAIRLFSLSSRSKIS